MGLMGTLGPMINSWACSHFLPLNGMVFLVRSTRLSSWTRHGWVEGDDAPEAKLRLTIEQSESLQRMPPPHWSVLQLTDRSSSRITPSSGARGRRRRKHSRSTTQSTVRSRTDPGRVLFPGLQLPWRSTSSRAAATSPATNNRCIYRSPARQAERRRGRQRPFFTGITVQRSTFLGSHVRASGELLNSRHVCGLSDVPLAFISSDVSSAARVVEFVGKLRI
jgi:hypothetical protein